MSKTVKKEETKVIERPLEMIAAEVRTIDQQAKQVVLHSAIEIGARLREAKGLVAHGKWKDWLLDNVSYSQSTANNFMRVSEEYANSQAFGNLSYTQAVALLSVPAAEREDFVEQNNVKDMSSRELQAAIKEKQELEKQLLEKDEKYSKWAEKQEEERKDLQEKLDHEKELRETHEQSLKQLQDDLKKASKSGDKTATAKLRTELRNAEKKASESQNRVDEVEKKLKKQEDDVEKRISEQVKAREKELAEQASQRESENAHTIKELQDKLRKNNNTAAIQVKVHFNHLTGTVKELLSAVSQMENEEQRKAIQDRIIQLCDEIKGNLS